MIRSAGGRLARSWLVRGDVGWLRQCGRSPCTRIGERWSRTGLPAAPQGFGLPTAIDRRSSIHVSCSSDDSATADKPRCSASASNILPERIQTTHQRPVKR